MMRQCIPPFVPDESASAFVPRTESVRCSSCSNSVLVTVVHALTPGCDGGTADDGRPFVIEQLQRFGWTVYQTESEVWADCCYHTNEGEPAPEVVVAEFDVTAFDMIANVISLACLACGESVVVPIRQKPDEVATAAAEHYVICQSVVVTWEEYRLNLPPRRSNTISAIEVVGRAI